MIVGKETIVPQPQPQPQPQTAEIGDGQVVHPGIGAVTRLFR